MPWQSSACQGVLAPSLKESPFFSCWLLLKMGLLWVAPNVGLGWDTRAGAARAA